MLNTIDNEALSNIKSVIIWGYPLHTHTLSYVHAAWFKVFSIYFKKDTHWFDDNNYPKDFNYENCMFITEGYCDNNIPVVASSIYFVHDAIHPEKYINKGARLIEIRFNVEEIHDINNNFDLNDGTHLNIINLSSYTKYEKLTSNKDIDSAMRNNIITQMNYECVYLYWATDLLPEEFNYEDIYLNREKEIFWIASPRLTPNYLKFVEICNKNNIKWYTSNPWTNPLPFEVTREYIKKSYLCPDFRPIGEQRDIDRFGIKNGQNHLAIGLIPCRIFKIISYGQLCITDSLAVKKLMGDHVVYDSDMEKLYLMGIKERLNYDKIKSAMKYVQENHTYVNRAIDLIKAISM